MTDCEKIHFAEAAESAELRYILSEMAKYPECDFSDFRRVYGSEQKLRCYAKNQKVREKFDLIDTDFSDSVVFGLYSLFSEKNKIEQARCAAGGMAKSKLYDRYKAFVRNEYTLLRQKRKILSNRQAADIIYPRLAERFKNCLLTEANAAETVRKWIGKIKKETEQETSM